MYDKITLFQEETSLQLKCLHGVNIDIYQHWLYTRCEENTKEIIWGFWLHFH